MKKKPSAKKPAPTIAEQVAAEVARQMPKAQIGLAVAMPNTTEKKMQAICELSSAINSLARALNSTNVEVQIENCEFANLNTGVHLSASNR